MSPTPHEKDNHEDADRPPEGIAKYRKFVILGILAIIVAWLIFIITSANLNPS